MGPLLRFPTGQPNSLIKFLSITSFKLWSGKILLVPISLLLGLPIVLISARFTIPVKDFTAKFYFTPEGEMYTQYDEPTLPQVKF